MELKHRIIIFLIDFFVIFLFLAGEYREYLKKKKKLDNLVSQDKIYVDLSKNDLSYLFNLMRYEHIKSKSEYFRKALREEIDKNKERE